MSNPVVREKEKIPAAKQSIVLILLIAIVVFAILIAKTYLVKEPTIEPVDLEIQKYNEAVAANPDLLAPRLSLAYAYQKTGDFEKAKAHYNEALKIEEKDQGAIYNLGVIALEEKKVDEAEKLFKQVTTINPNHVLGALGLSDLYIEQKKYDAAITALDTALKQNDNVIELHYKKGEALEKKGDIAKAKEEYKAVLKYVPQYTEAKTALERLK